MTIPEIKARLEKLSKVHPSECGGRVGDFVCILKELLATKEELEAK